MKNELRESMRYFAKTWRKLPPRERRSRLEALESAIRYRDESRNVFIIRNPPASLPQHDSLIAERDQLREALKDVSGLLCRLAASPDSRLTTNEVSQINARLDQARAALAKEREG